MCMYSWKIRVKCCCVCTMFHDVLGYSMLHGSYVRPASNVHVCVVAVVLKPFCFPASYVHVCVLTDDYFQSVHKHCNYSASVHCFLLHLSSLSCLLFLSLPLSFFPFLHLSLSPSSLLPLSPYSLPPSPSLPPPLSLPTPAFLSQLFKGQHNTRYIHTYIQH